MAAGGDYAANICLVQQGKYPRFFSGVVGVRAVTRCKRNCECPIAACSRLIGSLSKAGVGHCPETGSLIAIFSIKGAQEFLLIATRKKLPHNRLSTLPGNRVEFQSIAATGPSERQQESYAQEAANRKCRTHHRGVH